MENLTCEMVGFKDVELILRRKKSRDSSYFSIMIEEPIDNVIKFMTYQLVQYVNDKQSMGFIAGVAYMLDGSAFMVYRAQSKLMSVNINKSIIGNDNLFDYIAGYINSKNVEGLLLLQEIEPVNTKEYHFRLIHEEEKDM